ncbi:hypothetical protein [Endozoicomonas sp. GU-1]|nr:hypothetical protein [Endozoicomonas sp. GU-1]WBA81922.1 hypothetical protein O2T12_01765 [Endozoicomonas sp. GU-1]WBA84873.1 hypothetical protein O3276_16550 [Endozoicomonas sp. GU-1]
MEITVRHGKDGKDRMTLLPKASVEALQTHVLNRGGKAVLSPVDR